MAQARTEFAAALNQIASEKGVDVEVVLDAIRQAVLAAYKKDLMLQSDSVPDEFEEYTSQVDPVTGSISIFNKDKNITPPGFARIAASIAKQVIMQKLNEAERGAILAEYESKIGTLISGAIQRQEGNTYFIDLGRAEGVLPPSEQVHSEIYSQNQRLKFLVKEIREGGRGSEVVVSRSDPALVKAVFALEVPEIQSGAVEIKVIAREAGFRTKIAAFSTQEGVDPVGSLVGQKGVRVQAVMSELGEEKIDIINYSDDPARFVAAALSPAKDIKVSLNEADKVATVTVPQSQLSLAIGKGGQNVRLAAKLTGWKIDIEGEEEPELESEVIKEEKVKEPEDKKVAEEVRVDGEGAADGTAEKKEDTTSGSSSQPVTAKTDNTPAEDNKVQEKKDIEEEVKGAEENATTAEEKIEAQKAGETLEKAVDAENTEAEKKQLEEAIGEVKEESAVDQKKVDETANVDKKIESADDKAVADKEIEKKPEDFSEK